MYIVVEIRSGCKPHTDLIPLHDQPHHTRKEFTMSFSSIQDFRSRATENDLKELEDFINAQPKKADAFPNETYSFSYSSAANELRKHGYLGGERGQAPADEIPEFIIRPGEKKGYTSRSFSVQADILARIDKLAGDNWQYSRKAVINKLLDEALAKYGY